MGGRHLNQKHIKIVCKSLFTKGVPNFHHLHGLETRSPLANCSVDNDLSEIEKSDHTAIKRSFSS